MREKKLEKKTPLRQSSYNMILSAAHDSSHQVASSSDELVNHLVNVALNQDSLGFAILEAEQGSNFHRDLKNTQGKGVFHVLLENTSERTLGAILFLLEREASFDIKNNLLQTPFHLLAIHAPSSLILAFWEDEKIWDFLRNVQGSFDTPDAEGKTFLHYLMQRSGNDEYIRIILRRYYRHREVGVQDIEGNTPLHLAARCGNVAGVEFYLSRINEEYIHANEMFIITNHQGQTPGDLARLQGNIPIARTLYRREFNDSPFHDHLKIQLEKQKGLLSAPEVIRGHEQRIMTRLEQLGKIAIIPSSEIDDKVARVFQSLGILPIETDDGIEIQLDGKDMDALRCKDRRVLYELTPIGRLEWLLRDQVISRLKSFVQDECINEKIDLMETQHKHFYLEECREYEERMRDFSEGDEGYDYEGPIIPKPPQYTFDRNTVMKQLQAEAKGAIDWKDLEKVLSYVPVEAGLMGQMLYDDFIGMDMAEDLIKHLSKSDLGINPVLLSSLILNFDFQFSDMDITKDGFLIAAVRENFKDGFKSLYSDMEAKKLALDFIETCARSEGLVQDIRLYNEAAGSNNSVVLQGVWMRMQPLLGKYLQARSNNPPVLRRSLSTEFKKTTMEKDYVKLSKKTHNLVKVFPTDESRTLYYATGGRTITLDLKPLFKTLRTIAQETWGIISKRSSKKAQDEKTNVITGYLILVVSAKGSSRTLQTKFIRIPLLLNPEKRLLSKDTSDGIFVSEDEFHTSLGEDRQRGADIAPGEFLNIDTVSAGETAKQMACRILSGLGLPESARQEAIASIQGASVDKPVLLDYELRAPVQRSTQFYHSERVIFKALKMQSNINRMVGYLYSECRNENTFDVADPSTFQVEAGCLILYSYPNTVCEECSLGVLSLQHSEEKGFIHLLTQTLENFSLSPLPASSSSHGGSTSHGTPGVFTVSKKIEDSDVGFHLTTIVASEKIFSSDKYASILHKYPGAKIDHFVGPSFFSTPGIPIPSASSSLAPSLPFFYEFVGTNVSEVPTSIPYGGSVTMSGSKESKLGSQINDTEAAVAAVITKHDGELTPKNGPR